MSWTPTTSNASVVLPSSPRTPPYIIKIPKSRHSSTRDAPSPGGEVERVLKMVNGVVLVVDAFEGAMPQTNSARLWN